MKTSSVKNNYTVVFTTALILVFLGAVYFFVYVPQNEKRVQEQRFRSLQNIDKNIHEKIDNSVALMNNLLKNPLRLDYINHLNTTSKDNFTISVEPGNLANGFVVKNVIDSLDSFSVDNIKQQIVLSLIKKTKNNFADSSRYAVKMRFSIKQFFEFILPKNVFDEYVIFNKGEGVYTSIRSGINHLKDSLFSKTTGLDLAAARSYSISGNQYKVFLQPVSAIPGNDLTVAGLLSERRYQQERFRLPSSIVLLLITIVLGIMIAFPWIKLYQMGSKDRLTTLDGISCIIVSMLLMSLLFFSFFKYNSNLRPNDLADSKQALAKEISNAFVNEIGVVYQKLKFIDTTVKSHPQLYVDFNCKDSTKLKTIFPKTGSDSNNARILYGLRKDPGIRQVFWLLPDGFEGANWTSDSMNAPHGNFREREYFKNIAQQKGYTLNNDTAHQFYLDQVVSWTTGKFTSVLSIPSTVTGNTVAALSFTMKSLHQPVLPSGYHFAIIDKNGRVLYHSEEVRNLNENLITEFSANSRLRSCLEARSEDAFLTTYFSKNYAVWVKPLNKLPYFVTIFSNLDYRETRETAIYSFTFSMFLLLFLFFLLQLFFVFLISSRRSFFKKQLYDTAWVGPKTSAGDQYKLAILTNTCIIFLAIFFYHLSTFLTYVFILLFSVTFISIFLNSIFARKYKSEKPASYKFKIDTIKGLCLILLVIDVAAIQLLDGENLWLLAAYHLAAVLAGLFFYYRGKSVLAFLYQYLGKRSLSYSQSFSLMTLTRLIISSGIPVAFFYISAYNYEQNINVRYRQLQYANQLLNKLTASQLDSLENNNRYNKGYYLDNAWIKSISLDTMRATLATSAEDKTTSKILDLFRFHFTDLAVREDKFSASHAEDSSFFYNPLLKDACRQNGNTITYKSTSVPNRYLAIASAGLNYRVPSVASSSPGKGIYFWLLLVIALVVFYKLIHAILTKLFCLRLPDLSLCEALDEKILASQDLNNLTFVIGLPGSGKLARIKKELASEKIKYNNIPLYYNEEEPCNGSAFVADLINIPDMGDEKERNEQWNRYAEAAFAKNKRLVIVNHFEYNIQCAITNRIKLNFLERLMLHNKSKVMILSTIHPVGFLDSLVEQIETTEKPLPGGDLERWHVLLGHYRILVYKLEKGKKEQFYPASGTYSDFNYTNYHKETEYTHFLNKIHNPILQVARMLPDTSRINKADEIIFKLQLSSHYFYMYIWQSLTKEEKFLLYDLAEDNLVNSYDSYNLNMLLAKGVIVRNGTLKLFNRGFRNFILTAIGNTEFMKIKARIKDNGNWRKLRLPLLIILAAILTFLLASQKEVYSELLAYATALGAGIPAILKLFSTFDKTAQKQ